MKQTDYNNPEILSKRNIMKKREYLCVIMPAYNEGKNIQKNLLKASEIISDFVKNYRIIAVNDGSTDNTHEEILQATSLDSRIACVSYKTNRGKGHAISVGVKHAEAEYIAFLDSDLELNPAMLRYFFRALQTTDADIVIGSKLHKNSKLTYPMSRKIMSLGYYVILKLLFRLNIKDTQTGIKLFRSSVIKPICESLITTGFAFDIEILATACRQGYKIIELPITLVYSRNRHEKTRFPFHLIINIFKDTVKIKKKLRRK